MEITYIVGLVQSWVGIQITLGYHSGIPIWTLKVIPSLKPWSPVLTNVWTGCSKKSKCWNLVELKSLTQVNDNRFSLVWTGCSKKIQMLKPESNKPLTWVNDHWFSLVSELDAQKKFKFWNPGEIKPWTWVEFSSSCTYLTLVKIRFRLRLGRGCHFPIAPFSS